MRLSSIVPLILAFVMIGSTTACLDTVTGPQVSLDLPAFNEKPMVNVTMGYTTTASLTLKVKSYGNIPDVGFDIQNTKVAVVTGDPEVWVTRDMDGNKIVTFYVTIQSIGVGNTILTANIPGNPSARSSVPVIVQANFTCIGDYCKG